MKDTMKRTKSHLKGLNLKFILIGTSLGILVLLLVFRSDHSPSSNAQITKTNPAAAAEFTTMREAKSDTDQCVHGCNKIPASLAQALIHYTTSNVTPQQTFNEISVSARVLEQKSPCNFLVFGLGHDSLMWNTLNFGGRTVFLDEDEAWIKQISRRFPMLESYKVTYNTKVNQANELMHHGQTSPACKEVTDPRNSACPLALRDLPREVYETKWDVIMVDAPTGFHNEAPGRMTAIYTAGLMARNRDGSGQTDVFVHDVDRDVEDQFSKAFLCDGYLTKQEGRIRHFAIPSHRGDLERPFCPN